MRKTSSVSATGIVFFDIDGTLVPGTSSGSFLARRLGHVTELDAAEAAYAAGALSNHDVCVIDARGWAGALASEVDDWLDDLPLIDGVVETVLRCQSHNLVPVVASLAWDVVGEYLSRRFGFAAHCGPTLQMKNGRYTGKVTRTFDEYDKRDFALNLCQRYGVEASHCIAIGDSRSDLPLFGAVGHSIAFNGSDRARRTASVSIESRSILDVVPIIETWITNQAD
jgi:phosphoserine phosphatase